MCRGPWVWVRCRESWQCRLGRRRGLSRRGLATLPTVGLSGFSCCASRPQTERDVSVRQRAVDLLYAMCDRSNAQQIVAEMLSYLETADYSIREEIVSPTAAVPPAGSASP